MSHLSANGRIRDASAGHPGGINPDGTRRQRSMISRVREIFIDWNGCAKAIGRKASRKELAEMPGSLTSDQLHSYREDGFVKPIRAFSPERAVELRENIERIERECADADKPIDINQYFRVNGQIVIPLLYEMTRTEAVLDAIESVLGPNLLVWSCELFIKEAGSEKIVSWHQDMTYWGMGGSDKQATAWIAITNVPEEAGCMRFRARVSQAAAGSPHRQVFRGQSAFARAGSCGRRRRGRRGARRSRSGRDVHAPRQNFSCVRTQPVFRQADRCRYPICCAGLGTLGERPRLCDPCARGRTSAGTG